MKEIMMELYFMPPYLYYLRTHPYWYKILNEDQTKYQEFKKNASIFLHDTTFDKIEDWKKNLRFMESMIEYFTNKGA